MAITTRTVKNKRDKDGLLTGKAGTVYDVNIKYTSPSGKRTYAKKGFLTRQDAAQHEAEMRTKLIIPTYAPVLLSQSKLTVKEYLEEWVENHGAANLRPSTFASYKGHIKNHINPYIGHVQLRQLTPAMLDNMFKELLGKGLANSTVRYVQRVLSVSLEHAKRYRYIETNPARDIITKFGKNGKTPDPYTIEQLRELMSYSEGTQWEMPVMLAGLYGLRMGEILGLRWRNVDFEKRQIYVVEQLPFKLPAGTLEIKDMAPPKTNGRTLPITEVTLPYFERELALQKRRKQLAVASEYYDNDLVVARANGAPYRKDSVSTGFGQFIRRNGMPHIRFHDLRHTAATNMYELTGDFYTVGEILGHTLKGVGMALGISTKLDAVTAQYIDVRIERKVEVLNLYHKNLYPQ